MPGGYEAWYVDAIDTDRNLRLAAAFYYGYPFHPQYLSRLDAYHARPTRNAPPLPEEYPCVCLQIFQDDRRLVGAVTQYRKHSVRVSEENGQIAFGENKVEISPTGISVHLACVTRSHQIVSVDLILHPRNSPVKNIAANSRATSIKQDDLPQPLNPLWNAGGEIRIKGSDPIPLVGRGDFTNRYGAQPIGYGQKRVMQGSVLMEDQAIQFSIAWPRQSAQPAQGQCLRKRHHSPARWENQPVVCMEEQITLGKLPYPSGMNIGEDLILRRPQIMDRSMSTLALSYDAFVCGNPASSFFEIVYPKRLRLPVLRGVVERAIRIG